MVIQMKLETVFQIQSKVTNKCYFYQKVYSFYIPFVMLLQSQFIRAKKNYFIKTWSGNMPLYRHAIIIVPLLVFNSAKSLKSSNQLWKLKIKTNQHISEENYCNLNHIWDFQDEQTNANYT